MLPESMYWAGKMVFISIFAFASGGLSIKFPLGPYILLAWLYTWNLFSLQTNVPWLLQHPVVTSLLPFAGLFIACILLLLYFRGFKSGDGMGAGIVIMALLPFACLAVLHIGFALFGGGPILRMLSSGQTGWHLWGLLWWFMGIVWGARTIYRLFTHISSSIRTQLWYWGADTIVLSLVLVALLASLRCKDVVCQWLFIGLISIFCEYGVSLAVPWKAHPPHQQQTSKVEETKS